MSGSIINPSVLGLRNNVVSTLEDSTNNRTYYVAFIRYTDDRQQIVLYDQAMNYNPSTETLTVPNIATSGGGLNATTIDITDTDTAGTYYITFVDDVGNTKTLRADKTTTPLTYNPNTGIFNAENLNGQFLVIDATGNNSDYRLTSISNTPSTYNQMLYTDITYNPQTAILKVGKLDNCFALTSSGGNLPILFIDHTSSGKQFLYNNNNFYYNPTLGEFLLQGNLTTQNISGNQLTLTSTDAGSSPGPDLILYRNSASPAINDYIGQIVFKGRNTDPADTIYAKINCVLADASSAGGQSYIETTLLKSGSPILISRLLTTELQLLNGCGLNVDSYIEGKSHCVIEGKTAIGLAVGSSLIYKFDVYDTTSNHCKTAVRSSDQTLEISSYYQSGPSGGQYSYLQSRQEATQTNYSNLAFNPFGGSVGIGLTNPLVELHIQGSSGAITSNGLDGIVQIATGNTQTANKLCFGVVDNDYSYLQAYKNNSGGTAFAYADIILNSGGGNVSIGNTLTNTSLTISGNAGLLKLEGSDHCYIQFYPDTISAGRKGYLGYPGALSDDLVMVNENSNAGIGLYTTGGNLFINNSGNVGIGKTNPSHPLDVSGIINYTDRLIGGQLNGAENNHIDCYNSGLSTATRGIYLNYYANSGSGYSVHINASSYPRSLGLVVSGSSYFAGFITKAGGGFTIKHPVLGDNYRLVHSFVEAPEASNMYRGKAQLINGTIDVNIDKENNMTEGTFIALNTNFNIYVNNNDENSWDMVKGKLNGNILTIYSNNPECNAVIDYLVIGERQDEFMKSDKNDATDCCGKLIVERPATKTECNNCVDKDNEGSNNWKDYYNKENCECIDPYKCYDLH